MAGEFASSVALNLVSKLGEYLFAPIGRQFGYVLCYKSYVEDLENGVKEVEDARKRVQSSVDEAVYDGKRIHKDVENWLESVKKEIDKARNLLKICASAKNACFRGWLPNPVARHPIGRKVMKITKVIRGLHENSRNNIFQKVYYESPPIGIVPATTSAARPVDSKEDVLESRAKIMEDVMKAIVDDKVCVVGVWGAGGVGKSKLLEDVERQIKGQKLFDVVAKANISRNLDLKRIQGEIAYALGLKLMNEETAYGRADCLRKRLESDSKKNILIILDNLWEKLELKEVGIPCGDDNRVRGYKLLLTSRYRDVLRIDMSSDRQFQLSELQDGEAQRLFIKTVGDRVKDPEFASFAEGVVKNCGGLPLLIVPLAKRLKHGDLAAWRNASINIDVSNVKSLVELNYNDLKDERIRSLFLFCALNSGRIFVGHSLVCCMGLGLFEKFSKRLDNNRDRLIMDIHSLQDSSLLLDSDDKERFRVNDSVEFRMHDIFVDVAISMASREWNAFVGRKDYGFKEWSKDELKKCTAMSFPWVGIDELPEKLDCPNLRMLLLYEQNSSLKIPQSFFESMEKLQVLDITGLSFTSLPSSIELLGHLKSLCLDQCHLEDVTVLGKLKGLQFLSFLYSTISRLPKEIGELTKLRFLDLTGCTRLKVIKPGVLGSLVNLEELYMEDSFDQWEAEDEAPRSNASLAELKNMKNLSTLSIAIPHSANLPRYLPFGKLNNYKIQIGEVWDWLGKYKESKTLKLKLDSGNLLLEEWVSKCLQKTQDLHLDGLRDGIGSIHDLSVEGFQELKHLHVQNSPSFHYVVHSTEIVQCTVFTRLESLFLENLNNLEKICRGCLALESFSNLKIVKVDKCGEIKHLFHLSMKRIIQQLEEIEVSRCHLMQQIVAAEAYKEDEIDDATKVKSCNLRRLTLCNLPEMTSFRNTADNSVDFFDGQQIIKLQNLEAISIERCQLIQGVFDLEGLATSGEVEILSRLRELTLSDLPSLGHIWNKNPRRILCFQNLRTLKVQNCENLTFLFSSSMAKALGQIKEIEIVRCTLMEEIIDVQEEDSKEGASTNILEFPLLTSLTLEELPNLKTFSYGKYCIQCPTLTRLMITGCPKMMTFSSFEGKEQWITTDTGLRQAFGHTNPDLSLPIFFNEKVHFPSLEELKLSSMCQLKRIWPDPLHGQSLCKLASLTIELCENLSHVFPLNSIDRLQNLNEIEVVSCPSLEALFEPVSLSSEKRQKPLVRSPLKKVKLLDLPRLRDILKSDCRVTLAFPSLMEVNMRRCHSLPYLFSSATAKTLDKLAVLDVSCCNNLRGIIAMEEGKGNAIETLKFRHLSTLKLGDLGKLISFRSTSCAGDGLHPLFDEKVEFPSMESMKISCMDNVEKIWLGELASNAFPKLKILVVEYCQRLSTVFSPHINLTIFQNLEKITVTDCGSLEVIFHIKDFNFSEARCTSTFALRELVLMRLPKMKQVWSGLLQGGFTFGGLRRMEVVECESLKSLFPSSVAKSMTHLEELLVLNCGVEEIIVEEDGVGMNANDLFFPRLTDLRLLELPELRSFYRNNYRKSHTSTWPLLKQLRLRHCGKMRPFSFACEFRSCQGTPTSENQPALISFEKVVTQLQGSTLSREDVAMIQQHHDFENLIELHLACYHDENDVFPSDFLLQRFPNLEILTVVCSSFEEIFPECVFGHGGASVKRLGNLNQLRLSKLCNLRRVWKDGSLMAEILNHIRFLSIWQCPSLSIVFPSPASFLGLTQLNVEDCAGLVHVGTCSAVTSLVHLTWLALRNCGAMEDVVIDDGNGAEEISFPKLEVLTLDGLPSLESFSPANCVFKFPSLVHVVIMRCPNMNIFCKGALRTPKLDKVLLSDKDNEGRWEGDLNTTIETLSA